MIAYYLSPSHKLWLCGISAAELTNGRGLILRGAQLVCDLADPLGHEKLPAKLEFPLLIPVVELRAGGETRPQGFRLLPKPEDAKKLVSPNYWLMGEPTIGSERPCVPTPFLVVPNAVIRFAQEHDRGANWGVPGQEHAAYGIPVLLHSNGEQLISVTRVYGKPTTNDPPQLLALPVCSQEGFKVANYVRWVLLDAEKEATYRSVRPSVRHDHPWRHGEFGEMIIDLLRRGPTWRIIAAELLTRRLPTLNVLTLDQALEILEHELERVPIRRGTRVYFDFTSLRVSWRESSDPLEDFPISKAGLEALGVEESLNDLSKSWKTDEG